MEDFKFYTVNEIMEILKCTRVTIYNNLKSGKLKGKKVTGKWLFTKEDIDNFVNKV